VAVTLEAVFSARTCGTRLAEPSAMNDTNHVWRRMGGLGNLAAILLLTGTLVGCGGDDDAGMFSSATDTPFSSTLPYGTTLGALTHDQQFTLCSELTRFAFVSSCGDEATCLWVGISSAGLAEPKTDAYARAACSDAYQDCKAQLGAGTFPSKMGCGTVMISPLCTATVGELTTCLNDLEDAIDMRRGATQVCNSLTLAQLSTGDIADTADAGPDARAVPASCRTMTQKCSSE